MSELTKLEKEISKIQVKLIDRGKDIEPVIKNQSIQSYAAELTETYYPKNKNLDYLEPIITSFAIDLATAPRHHSKHYLWKYNYDDLDILSKFYKLSTPTKKYFHLAQGTLPKPNLENFKEGCNILRLDLGKYTDEIFEIYEIDKAKSKIASRIVETISGAEHDEKVNLIYGFNLDQSKRNLRAIKGLGKFQYLRKGRNWFALGSAPAEETKDIRQEAIEILGYTVRVTNNKVVTEVTKDHLDTLKGNIKNLLDSDAAIYFRLNRVNEMYKNFHQKRRFSNATQWNQIDFWLNQYSLKKRKSYPKLKGWTNYNAAQNRSEITFAPKRTNFFWNSAEELHCDFKKIWNPYNW
jgi:hypothetical protein